MMVPGFSNGLQQGNEMPNSGTAQDGRCLVCGKRFSARYWSGTEGPYCAQHFPLVRAREGEQ
jgi:hypothetical protein